MRSKTLPGSILPVPDQLDQLGQEPAHRCRSAVQVHAGEEQLVAGQRDVVGDADVADVAAGRVARMACIIDSCVPTASMTLCAPSPPVSSLIFATPSSPRSSTMSVAPNSRASAWRSAWRLIAMIRSAPSCLAASTPSRPDRAVADDRDRLAGPGLGGDGGEPAGAEHVGGGQQRGDQVGVGLPGGGDEGAVGERDAGVLGLGAGRRTGCRCTQWDW